MSRFLVVLPWLLAGVLSGQAQAPTLEPVWRAELAFARQADTQGIRPAFLAWLAEDARVFVPRMTSARVNYGPEPGDPGHLVWYPEAMGISASGDLAWSHGPWTYAPKKGAPILVHGHFLSVWGRTAQGQWKVLADIGVPHAAPATASEPFAVWEASPQKGANPAPVKAGGDLTQLRASEARLAAVWSTQGGLALLPELAEGARVLRPRQPPLVERATIQAALKADPAGPGWDPATVEVAASGDLGWTCGETGRDGQGRSASFLRIWVFEAGTWKVRFDVRLPISPANP